MSHTVATTIGVEVTPEITPLWSDKGVMSHPIASFQTHRDLDAAGLPDAHVNVIVLRDKKIYWFVRQYLPNTLWTICSPSCSFPEGVEWNKTLTVQLLKLRDYKEIDSIQARNIKQWEKLVLSGKLNLLPSRYEEQKRQNRTRLDALLKQQASTAERFPMRSVDVAKQQRKLRSYKRDLAKQLENFSRNQARKEEALFCIRASQEVYIPPNS